MSELFFSADLHAGHRVMLGPGVGRPFASVQEMDEYLLEAWNAKVQTADTVYLLGDVCLCGSGRAKWFLSQLQGTIHLIRGNHDRKLANRLLRRFATVQDYLELRRGPQLPMLVLCHYPLLSWNKSHWGSWHLHGHSHGGIPFTPRKKRLDVGIDNSPDFAPFALAQIEALLC